MIRLILWILSILSLSCALKVMTVNMNNNESMVTDGIHKLAIKIKQHNPDIVALQETGYSKDDSDHILSYLLKVLGNDWSGLSHCHQKGAIITRHSMLDMYGNTKNTMFARIRSKINHQEISFWSVNFDSENYGPYEASNANHTLETIINQEEVRIKNLVQLLKHPHFTRQIKNAERIPVIVAGTFNTPSHLDWTDESKSKHNGLVVEWPVTKILADYAGMTDSFREVNPDPTKEPGVTWPVFDVNEDQKVVEKDRIDYIFYRGSMKAKTSFAYAEGVINGINGRYSGWPTDHFAVITEFEPMSYMYKPAPTWKIPAPYNAVAYNNVYKCTPRALPIA